MPSHPKSFGYLLSKTRFRLILSDTLTFYYGKILISNSNVSFCSFIFKTAQNATINFLSTYCRYLVTVLLNLKFLVSEKQNKIIFHRYACLLQHRCCCDLRREVKDRKMITTKKFVPIFNLYKVVCSWAQPTDWRSIFWLSGLRINTCSACLWGSIYPLS